MNLTLFFRLIMVSIFDKKMAGMLKNTIFDCEHNYDNTYFWCPPIYAKDGFNVSLQLNNANYCSSENG